MIGLKQYLFSLPECEGEIMSIISKLKNKAMKKSREEKLKHFYSLCNEEMKILDVGVSSELREGTPARNYFLKNFNYDSKYYTGLGVQDLSGMGDLYPGKRFVQYEGGKFPFADNEFDWIFSNAVIEHVGDDEAQLMFINEMLRVAKNVFFTTPNKYFPIEAHTNVFFLHWDNSIFYNWCKKHRQWVTRNNLYLLSGERLRKLMDLSNAASYEIRKNYLFWLVMTYTITCTKLDTHCG